MDNNEVKNERNNYYTGEIKKKSIISGILKKSIPFLTAAFLSVTIAGTVIPVSESIKALNANSRRNAIVEMINTGDYQNLDKELDSMAKYIKNTEDMNAFNKMSREEKIVFVDVLVSKLFRDSNVAISAGIVAMMTSVLLSKITDLIAKEASLDLDKLKYEMYLDEQCNPKDKKNLKKRDLKAIENHIKEGDPQYTKSQAEKNIGKRVFADDKQVVFSDYELGFNNGKYDFYSRCNYGCGDIYNKAVFYYKKGLSADRIDKKLVEVSYKKGYYRSAGLYVANRLACGYDLNDEEQAIIDNMENLSVNNVQHINRYNATEVKNCQDYWLGYVEGFKSEISNNYSSIDFDFSELSEDVKRTIEESLDNNKYKLAFYKGIEDGMDDLGKKARQMARDNEELEARLHS